MQYFEPFYIMNRSYGKLTLITSSLYYTYILVQNFQLRFSSVCVIAGLGEQCFQDDTCQLHDKHAVCAQVDHNAICKCKQGYHIVTVSRPTNARSSFCAQGTLFTIDTIFLSSYVFVKYK